jgi:hypothetical protein
VFGRRTWATYNSGDKGPFLSMLGLRKWHFGTIKLQPPGRKANDAI